MQARGATPSVPLALARLEQSGKLQETLDRWIPVTKVAVEPGSPPPVP